MLNNSIDSQISRAKERLAAQQARIQALESKKDSKIHKKKAQHELEIRE